MSWSLNRFPVNRDADAALHAMGRALYIATQFEEKAKYLLRVVNLEAAYVADPLVGLEQLIDRLPHDKLLHDTLQELARVETVVAAQAEVLAAARRARNAIAHELAAFPISEQPGPSLREATAGGRFYDSGPLRRRLELLRTHTRALAAGDNLVSGWCFDIDSRGKEDRPSDFIAGYDLMVERWVLEPVRGLLDGS